MASMETRLIPQAVRTAPSQGRRSLPRRRRVVSRRMEVEMPAVTVDRVSVGMLLWKMEVTCILT